MTDYLRSCPGTYKCINQKQCHIQFYFFNSGKEKLPSNRKKTGKSAIGIKSKTHTFHFCFCTAVSTGHTRYGKPTLGEIRKLKVCFTVTDFLSVSLKCGQQYYVPSPFVVFSVQTFLHGNYWSLIWGHWFTSSNTESRMHIGGDGLVGRWGIWLRPVLTRPCGCLRAGCSHSLQTW